jgi:hypothetical protein
MKLFHCPLIWTFLTDVRGRSHPNPWSLNSEGLRAIIVVPVITGGLPGPQSAGLDVTLLSQD